LDFWGGVGLDEGEELGAESAVFAFEVRIGPSGDGGWVYSFHSTSFSTSDLVR
jgi:hypothetical protein